MTVKYSRKVKELMIKEVKNVVSGSNGVVLASIENVKATEIDILRKRLRQAGSRYLVVKNRIAHLALKELGIEGLSSALEEKKVLGLGLVKKDPVTIVKLIVEFSKENKGFKISKGYLDGQVLAAERIKELSELPGREVLLAMIVRMLNTPLTNFAGTLAAIVRKPLYALNAIKEKKTSS